MQEMSELRFSLPSALPTGFHYVLVHASKKVVECEGQYPTGSFVKRRADRIEP